MTELEWQKDVNSWMDPKFLFTMKNFPQWNIDEGLLDRGTVFLKYRDVSQGIRVPVRASKYHSIDGTLLFSRN